MMWHKNNTRVGVIGEGALVTEGHQRLHSGWLGQIAPVQCSRENRPGNRQLSRSPGPPVCYTELMECLQLVSDGFGSKLSTLHVGHVTAMDLFANLANHFVDFGPLLGVLDVLVVEELHARPIGRLVQCPFGGSFEFPQAHALRSFQLRYGHDPSFVVGVPYYFHYNIKCLNMQSTGGEYATRL